MNQEAKQYPIGKFTAPTSFDPAQRAAAIATIGAFPQELAALVEPLSPEHLSNQYREGGWSILQVVHHCSDSHINAFVRFKLALTEDTPKILGYQEAKWVMLPDNDLELLPVTLQLLTSLHAKWHALLAGMSATDFERSYFHPEFGRTVPLNEVVLLYQWHCQHHLAHVKLAINEPV